MTAERYEGGELELFRGAGNWKAYLRRRIGPYLRGRVLEVGAGIGGTTRALVDPAGVDTWLCLEPDPELARRVRERVRSGELPPSVEVRVGTVEDVAEERFDAVLYVDVLEHIPDDRAEAARASLRLRPGGHLVVLAPAHPWLFSPFDDALGHHRRYTRRTLRDAIPLDLIEVECLYLDSAGLLASGGNRLLLRSSMPTATQIAFWDGVLVRASRVLDPILGHAVGKSILGVWQRDRGTSVEDPSVEDREEGGVGGGEGGLGGEGGDAGVGEAG